MEDLIIDTVDAFQGSEMDYIFLSMVRSSPLKRTGFIKDYKRTNVGISRHKLALFIFGDKRTLKTIDFWREIIEASYVVNQNSDRI